MFYNRGSNTWWDPVISPGQLRGSTSITKPWFVSYWWNWTARPSRTAEKLGSGETVRLGPNSDFWLFWEKNISFFEGSKSLIGSSVSERSLESRVGHDIATPSKAWTLVCQNMQRFRMRLGNSSAARTISQSFLGIPFPILWKSVTLHQFPTRMLK